SFMAPPLAPKPGMASRRTAGERGIWYLIVILSSTGPRGNRNLSAQPGRQGREVDSAKGHVGDEQQRRGGHQGGPEWCGAAGEPRRGREDLLGQRIEPAARIAGQGAEQPVVGGPEPEFVRVADGQAARLVAQYLAAALLGDLEVVGARVWRVELSL